jgi:hypothetical protein
MLITLTINLMSRMPGVCVQVGLTVWLRAFGSVHIVGRGVVIIYVVFIYS